MDYVFLSKHFGGIKTIAICTNIDTAKLLTYKCFQDQFGDISNKYFMQYKENNNKINCEIVNTQTNEIFCNFATIEKITLNERLF